MKAGQFPVSWPRVHLAAWTGLLLDLAHGWWAFLAPVAPVPLLVALRGVGVRPALYLGGLCGVLEAFILAGSLHAYMGTLLFAGLCVAYAINRAAFAVPCAWLGGGRGLGASLVPPSLWVLGEWAHARVDASIPNILGDTQHVGPLLPLARLGGTHLASFVLVWLAAWLAQAWWAAGEDRPGRRQAFLAVGRAAVAWAAVVGVAWWAAQPVVPAVEGRIKVAAVQGGLPTWVYVAAEGEPAWEGVPERVYAEMTRRAPPAELTIWPETAVWRLWGKDAEWEGAVRALQAERGGAMLLGTPRLDDLWEAHNSSILLTSGRQDHVDKRRPVFRAEDAFQPGLEPRLLHHGPARVGVVFCVESLVPRYGLDVARAGANLLVTLADGSRFNGTPVGRMLAQRTLVRAVEVGLPVVLAGQHGFTTLVSPLGTWEPPAEPFTTTTRAWDVPLLAGGTPYTRWGDWPAGVSLVIVLGALTRRAVTWQAASRSPRRDVS
jgi:apolipoprotein N-acyltransferase